MKTDEFLNEMVELLELDDELGVETNLKELDEFDSLAIMGIIAFVDENFDVKLTGQQLAEITSVKSLMDLIGSDKFTE
jgi:acyl carrier protein